VAQHVKWRCQFYGSIAEIKRVLALRIADDTIGWNVHVKASSDEAQKLKTAHISTLQFLTPFFFAFFTHRNISLFNK